MSFIVRPWGIKHQKPHSVFAARRKAGLVPSVFEKRMRERRQPFAWRQGAEFVRQYNFRIEHGFVLDRYDPKSRLPNSHS